MRSGSTLRLIVSLITCFLPSAVGAMGQQGGGEWYQSLTKPPLNPPGWVFGPVWSTLYLLMGISLFLVWERHDRRGATLAVDVFGAQLVLNAAWSPAFFTLHSPALALAIIIPMLILIALSILLFRRVSPPAGWLLLPYLAWVSFATYLNASIWWLNR